MKAPELKTMLHAGVHFGHQTLRWNPKMKPYILAEKNGIHIIDLAKTQKCLEVAIEAVQKSVRAGNKVLFVGTKKSVKDSVKEEAKRCGQYFTTERWLGGMLTNFATVKKSIAKLDRIDKMEADGVFKEMTKKETIVLGKKRFKLESVLGGIRHMTKLPGMMFVLDIKNEHIAIQEAKKLKIPVIGLVDSNSNPDDVDYPIPGNDDAIKSVTLITSIIADAILENSKSAPATQDKSKTEAKKAPEDKKEAVAAGEKK